MRVELVPRANPVSGRPATSRASHKWHESSISDRANINTLQRGSGPSGNRKRVVNLFIIVSRTEIQIWGNRLTASAAPDLRSSRRSGFRIGPSHIAGIFLSSQGCIDRGRSECCRCVLADQRRRQIRHPWRKCDVEVVLVSWRVANVLFVVEHLCVEV